MNNGSAILTDAIPRAFWTWFSELKRKYPYGTIELNRSEIVVCRVRTPVEDEHAIEKLGFGKIVYDSSGCFLERTFRPRYHSKEDVVKTMP